MDAPCARIQAGDAGVQARQPEQQNADADERNPKEASLGHGIFPASDRDPAAPAPTQCRRQRNFKSNDRTITTPKK